VQVGAIIAKLADAEAVNLLIYRCV